MLTLLGWESDHVTESWEVVTRNDNTVHPGLVTCDWGGAASASGSSFLKSRGAERENSKGGQSQLAARPAKLPAARWFGASARELTSDSGRCRRGSRLLSTLSFAGQVACLLCPAGSGSLGHGPRQAAVSRLTHDLRWSIQVRVVRPQHVVVARPYEVMQHGVITFGFCPRCLFRFVFKRPFSRVLVLVRL